MLRASRSPAAGLFGLAGAAARPQRPRHHHRVDAPAAFCPTPRRANRMSAAKCWRRYSDEPYRQKPVAIPSGVTATIEGALRQGSERHPVDAAARRYQLQVEDDGISVQPANDTKRARAFWGMQRTLVQNLVTGVTEGFTKTLEITGVGYRAASQGKNLKLQLGYSHDVDLRSPRGSRSRHPTRRRSRSAASTSSRSARSPRKSADGASPSLTRARASNIAASMFSARKGRRSNGQGTLRLRKAAPARAHCAAAQAAIRPRLSIHRTGRHIYAQVIDDKAGRPSPRPRRSTRTCAARPAHRRCGGGGRQARCRARPRPPASPRSCSIAVALFHGRIKALADAAREGGLEF